MMRFLRIRVCTTLLICVLGALLPSRAEVQTQVENFPRRTLISVSNVAASIGYAHEVEVVATRAVMYSTDYHVRNALRWTMNIPLGNLPSIDVKVGRWKKMGTLSAVQRDALLHVETQHLLNVVTEAGSYNYQPQANVTIVPFKRIADTLWVADQFTVDVTWMEYLQKAPTPDRYSRAINKEYISGSLKSAKLADAVQHVDPSSWYIPGAPYARIVTNRDGIAFVTFRDVVAQNDRFSGVDINQLVLFWRGMEEYLHVHDADQSSTFTLGDTLWFKGRHPSGDTTWLDRYDTVSVFMLTTQLDGFRKRFEPFEGNGSGSAINVINAVTVHDHIELDTGHYHLGSSKNLNLSDYNSHWATFEGYYWHRFTVEREESRNQKLHVPIWCIPADEQSVTITARLVSSTDIDTIAPDNRADVALNGRDVTYFEEDGYGLRPMPKVLGGVNRTHGSQHISIYATGISGKQNNPGYFSETLFDAIDIDGRVQPVVSGGSLTATVSSISEPSFVGYSNARTAHVYALDTTTHRFTTLAFPSRGLQYTAGLAPIDLSWPTEPWDNLSHRATIRVDNEDVEVPLVGDVTVVTKSLGSALTVQSSMSATSAATILNAAPVGSFVLVIATPLKSNGTLEAAVKNAINIQPANFGYIAAGIVGTNGKISAGDGSSLGLSAFISNVSFGNSYSGSVWLPPGPDRVLIVSDKLAVQHADVQPARMAGLSVDNEAADYLIVTPATHKVQAERLAEFRRNRNGIRVKVVSIESINDEFGAGTQSPEALREYIHKAWSNESTPRLRYVLFFGNASWDPRLAVKQGNVGAALPNQILTYGRPSSDYWYGLLDEYDDARSPEVIVSRLPAITAEQGKTIVDKIIYMDTVSFQPWMRKWYFVGGGNEQEGLCSLFEYMLDDALGTGIRFDLEPTCWDTATLCKFKVGPDAGYVIKSMLNSGVQWMNYIGHGATTQFDITGFNADELQNPGKYGILATYACQTGAFSNPSLPCKNSEYITVDNKGLVAAVGGTGWEFSDNISIILFHIHNTIRNGGRDLGEVVYNAKLNVSIDRGPGYISEGYNSVMQYSILGDPLTRIKMDTIPDVYIRHQDLSFTSKSGSTDISKDDSVVVLRIDLQNAGTGTSGPLEVQCIHTYQGGADTSTILFDQGICISTRIAMNIKTYGVVGQHDIKLVFDPRSALVQNKRADTITSSFTVYERTLQPLQPHPYGYIIASAPFVRVIDPLFEVNGNHPAHFVISTEQSTNQGVLWQSKDSDVTREESIVDWKPTIDSAPSGLHWLGAWVDYSTVGIPTNVLWIPVHIVQTPLFSGHPVSEYSTSIELLTPDQLQYDASDSAITIFNKDLPLYIVSSSKPTDNLEKDPIAVIKVGERTYLYTGYNRGLNVGVFAKGDSVPYALRWYDTFYDKLPSSTPDLDGYAEECLTFLQDSIRPTDRVVILACNESFTQFEQKNLIDSLRTLAKDMGSGFADSLGENSSWILYGRKGLGEGNGEELWRKANSPEQLLRMNTTIKARSYEGSVATDWFGPMKALDSILVGTRGSGITAVAEMKKSNGEIILDTIGANAWMATKADSTVRMVRIRAAFNESDTMPMPSAITAVHVNYTPADEWVMMKNAVLSNVSEALRGDTISVTTRVRNARTDQPTSTTTLHMFISPRTGTEPISITNQVESIAPDGVREYVTDVNSGIAGSTAVVRVVVNPGNTQAESFSFNNTRSTFFTVRDDTVKPKIVVVIDADTVMEGMFVLPNALFEVLLYDESRLPIADEARLSVYVNGTRIRQGSSDNYRFIPTDSIPGTYPDVLTLRAAATFGFTLDEGQNNILVRSSDASDNQTIYEASVWVSTRTALQEITVSPNPTTGPVVFSVSLADTVRSREAILDVYDSQGRQVLRRNVPLTMGRSAVNWNGRSDDGDAVSTGMYYWRLYLDSLTENGENTRSGQVLILR